MSSDTAIEVAQIGKRYQIYESPSDRLKQFFTSSFATLFGINRRSYAREFWALRDVSFALHKGESLGIIGRNGSGKSTLLQLICGTLTPTNGTVKTYGRVAALLELGSGFNPELTGAENVHLNAAVLGLTEVEIKSKFESIVAFADIGLHLHQPVKTYSSGMLVRLAFAVVTHVDADILVIDEALAVGDAAFTQKCMRFVREFQKTGTLLFVSHDASAVTNLCARAIWLDGGCLRHDGNAKQTTEAYLQDTLQSVYGSDVKLSDASSTRSTVSAPNELVAAFQEDRETTETAIINYGAKYEVRDNLGAARGFSSGKAKLLEIGVSKLDLAESPALMGGERVRLFIRAKALVELKQPILGFAFFDRLGQTLFGENTLALPPQERLKVNADEEIEAIFEFRLPMLPNGDYAVFASVADGTLYDNIQHHLLHDALIVTVQSSKVRWGLVGIPFERIDFKVCG